MRSAGRPAFAKLLKTIRTNLPVYHDPYFSVRLIRGGLGTANLRSTRIYTTVSDIHHTAKIAKEGTLGLYLSNKGEAQLSSFARSGHHKYLLNIKASPEPTRRSFCCHDVSADRSLTPPNLTATIEILAAGLLVLDGLADRLKIVLPGVTQVPVV